MTYIDILLITGVDLDDLRPGQVVRIPAVATLATLHTGENGVTGAAGAPRIPAAAARPRSIAGLLAQFSNSNATAKGACCHLRLHA